MVLPREPIAKLAPFISPVPTPASSSFSPPKTSFTPSPILSPLSPKTSFIPPPSSFSTSFPPSSLRPLGAPTSYIPSPSLIKPNLSNISPSKVSSPHSALKFLVILVIIGGFGFGVWYYRTPITARWNSLINGGSQTPSSLPTENTNPSNSVNLPVEPTPPPVVAELPKDCGTGTAPKLGILSAKNDPTFSCLGASAINCDNAKGTLKDNLFPTIFEIIKTENSCNFKLSYPEDSTLSDVTGKRLAGQYISCPIDIVKTIDNTKPATPKFNVPSKTDLVKYADDVYIYGTLGVFVENNLDLNKIQTLGCSGPYIQSVIASYAAKKAK